MQIELFRVVIVFPKVFAPLNLVKIGEVGSRVLLVTSVPNAL
jgi:hypothetical protein